MTRKEYNKCVDLYADRVYRFIIKNMKHHEDAQDVVQNAFEKLWIHSEKVFFEKARSYLFTTAYRTGLTVAQVKVYIYRGRKKLQQFLVSVEKAI